MSDIFSPSEVANRYAKASFELAHESKALDKVAADLTALKAMLSESADLRRLLQSAQFKSDQKLSGLMAVAKSLKLQKLTLNSLGLLARHGRLNVLGAYINAFFAAYEAQQGVSNAEVISAVALSDQQVVNLRTALHAAIGRECQLNLTVDPGLLGGLKVRIGSRLFDSSLKTKLDTLKFALKRA